MISLALGFLAGFIATVAAINSTGLTDTVQWDPHSLFLFGQRVFILSAEVHPWRSVNPNLWRDVFDKIKANGFNTVSFYTHWGLHYPSADVNGDNGDFTAGTYRDIQMFIDEAQNAGLWLIARPGPYVNGETSGGGIPGWASNNLGTLRTNASDYTAAWKPYITQMAKLVAKNQISNGGPIIMVQAENEFSQAVTHNPYMQAIEDTYRTNGVTIPFTHNDQHSGQTGNFSPDKDTTPGNGAVNIYCGDSYPQGSSSWAPVQTIYRSAHEGAAPSNPLCLAEFGGGFLINWGGSPIGGTGYEKFTNIQDNADYENVFYKDTYAQTTTILNIYMTFGGTNWGNTAEPTVYSSYDYGAGINENRVLTPKMAEMRLQGSFLRVSRDLLSGIYIGNGTNFTTSDSLFTQELRSEDTGAGFYFVRHADSTSLATTLSQLTVSTSQGGVLIPRSGSFSINGREQKILVTDYVFGASKTKILYTTSEVFTWGTMNDTDYIVLYAKAGQTGETTFVLPEDPVQVTASNPSINVTSGSNSSLTLNYNLSGLDVVDVTLSSTSVKIILMDRDTVGSWHAPILANDGPYGNFFSIGSNETVLVGGPYLVRQASVDGSTLAVKGDLNGTTRMEFFVPIGVDAVTWNGKQLALQATSYGSFISQVEGIEVPALPKLGPWKVIGGLPEANASFDDNSFTSATQTTTNYTALPPLTPGPVLYSQQYGFFGGIQLYRGHFNASGKETGINMTVQGGFAFAYSAFLNGVFLGSGEGSPTVSLTANVWSISRNSLVVGKENVLTVMMDHMGLVETSTNSGKEPRGIRGISFLGSNTAFTEWKIQGNLGGNKANPDTFRGYLNEDGIYPIRIGAHLPGFDDSTWESANSLSVTGAGIDFFRSTFTLSNAFGDNSTDIPLRLSFTPGPTSSKYRAKLYLNGWGLGEYINDIGPQTVFVLPSGILRRSSSNTLCLSLWSLGSSGATAEVKLVADGAFTSSNSFSDWVDAPDYERQKASRPIPAAFSPM